MVHIADQLAIAIQQSELYLQLQEANKKLQLLASTDGLTQVANRRYFDETLGKEWQRMKREKEPLSLLFTDIDWFKSYNDHYGHQAGDDCLCQVAQAIIQVVSRPGDLVARYGGEEFVIILSNTDSQGAVQVAEKIRQAIADLQIIHPDSLVSRYLTVSLGIASVVPTEENAPDLIISQADQALYLAKSQGRDRFLVYDPSIDSLRDCRSESDPPGRRGIQPPQRKEN
jgi:diguanylate cyclase (GGDEF)-like protein